MIWKGTCGSVADDDDEEEEERKYELLVDDAGDVGVMGVVGVEHLDDVG